MKPIPISIQLYTVRERIATDVAGELRKIADAGYKGVEVGGFYDLKPEEFHSLLNDVGLVMSAAWTVPTKENIAATIDTYSRFGIKHFVSSCDPEEVRTIEDCKQTAAKFQAAALVAKEHGFKFGFHNHYWEFERLPDGRLPYDIFMAEAPDAFGEFDVYWAEFAGTDAAEVIRRYQPRMELLHVKDGFMAADHSMSAVGKGKLNMPAILGEVDPAVTQWLTVEIDACHTDMDEAVRDSCNYLVGSGFGEGTK